MDKMLDQPSIQSFYGRISQESSTRAMDTSSPSRLGDGFTSQELSSAAPLSLSSWCPKGQYTARDIDTVMPGPGCVKIVGRVINMFKKPWTSSQPQGLRASGYTKMIIRDDTGIITVPIFSPSDAGSSRTLMRKSSGQAFLG